MTEQEILDALCAEVPAEIQRRNPLAVQRAARRGSCVQSTRVGIEALRYFGVEAKPLVTLLMTGNAAWVEWMGQDVPPLPMPDPVWAVGTDPEQQGERGYPAHLVIAYDGGLLDLDAGFYTRPERHIHIPPTVFLPLMEPGPNGVIAATSLKDEGVLFYREWKSEIDFRQIGAWRDSRKWAGPVIRAMKERLA